MKAVFGGSFSALPAVRSRIILVARRGGAATFDPYAVGPARQLRENKFFEFTRAGTRPATQRSPRALPQLCRKGAWGAGWPTQQAAAKHHVLVTICAGSSAQLGLARALLQRSLLPRGQLHSPPLFAGGQAYPRAVRNGPVRCENAAETAIESRVRERVFAKTMHLGRMASPVDGDDHRTSQ